MARRPSPRRAIKRDQDLGVDYTRYSTDDQGSTQEQRSINEEIAAEEGVTIVRSFGDEGISRSLSDRPGLRDLFAYLEGHPEVGFIVVNELERMTAGINQRQDVTRICKQLRITIITEDMGRIDPHDEDKMQEADQRAVTAKGEVLKVRRRTRRNLRQKVRNKTIVALRPAYGTRMKPLTTPEGIELPSGVAMLDGQGRKVTSGVLEKHPDEYPWLVRIFEWADAGASLTEIGRRLMSEGVPTKTGKTTWDTTTIAGILENPLYMGVMSWGVRKTLRDENGRRYQEFREEDDPQRVTMESPLGALVDVKMWERINARRAEGGITRQQQRRTLDPQPLDHFVFCGRCGHKMYGRADPTRSGFTWRYLCLSSYGSMNMRVIPEFGSKCAKAHSISLKDLLAGLAGEAGYRGTTMELRMVKGGRHTATTGSQRQRMESNIETAEAELANAKRLAIKGLINDQELEEARADANERIADANARLQALDQEPQQVPDEPLTGQRAVELNQLAQRLADESIPVEFRRSLLSDMKLEAIYVDKPTLRLYFRD